MDKKLNNEIKLWREEKKSSLFGCGEENRSYECEKDAQEYVKCNKIYEQFFVLCLNIIGYCTEEEIEITKIMDIGERFIKYDI